MNEKIKIRANELKEGDVFMINTSTYKVAFLDDSYIYCHLWYEKTQRTSDRFQLGRNSQKLVYKIIPTVQEKVV